MPAALNKNRQHLKYFDSDNVLYFLDQKHLQKFVSDVDLLSVNATN